MPETFVPTNYLAILIFIFIAMAFGGVSLMAGYLVRPSRPYRTKLMPYESGMDPFTDARIPFPTRYYIIAMLFVIFDIEVVFMYPWAVVYNQIGLYGLIEMILFIGILFVGYFYAWMKGALEWD